MVTYQIIRADNIFTVLILPDIWYIDSYFRNTRIKGLFYVTKRGRVAFWGGNKLRKMLELNQQRQIKKYFVVQPNFTDKYPIYKGVMAEEYKKLKEKKTTEARKKILENNPTHKEELKNYKVDVAWRLVTDGISQKKAADYLGVTQKTISNWIRNKE